MKFKTHYKEKVWGGQKIKTYLGKDYGDLKNCGETWEVSGVKGNVSLVANGHLKGRALTDLLIEYKEELVGKHVYDRFGNEFPLLIKFIDAAEDLSVQVHPDDEMASKRHNSKGKSEMWYIMQADPGAQLIIGFNQPMDAEQLQKRFDDKKVMECLNYVDVKQGDVFYLPAGRVHSIGGGCMLAEIQQTSDITYRIFDFDRPDINGNMRELHVKDGIEASDFTQYEEYRSLYERKVDEVVPVVETPFFNTKVIELEKTMKRNLHNTDSFHIYICTQGEGLIQTSIDEVPLKQGEAILIPASIPHLTIKPNSKKMHLLETGIDH